MKMDKSIILVGFRAVGKTTVGKKLAERMGRSFFDTDLMIVDRTDCSIRKIIEGRGWEEFRRLEYQVLKEIGLYPNCVVATGGGAILHRERWRELKADGFVVWLTASLGTVIDRLAHDSETLATRPSLTGESIFSEVHGLLIQREPLYRETAHLAVDTEKYQLSDIVSIISDQYCRAMELGEI